MIKTKKDDKITITIRITKDLNKQLENVSKEFHNSKSGFLNLLIESFIKNGKSFDKIKKENRIDLQGINKGGEYPYKDDKDFIQDIKNTLKPRDFDL